MNEPLEPMSPAFKALLQEGSEVRPPPGTSARILAQLQAATALPPPPPISAPPLAAPVGAAGIGARFLVAGLVIGAAGGLIAGRTVFERVEVRVIERTLPAVVQLPTPEPVAPPAPEVKVAPVPVPEHKEPRKAPAPTDDSLAQERSLLETARSALVRGDAAKALESVNEHQRRFAEGRMIEERESLAIQALLRLGQSDAARARAAKFHQRWPDSLFGPVVDAAAIRRSPHP